MPWHSVRWLQFQAVADDASVAHQGLHLSPIVAGNLLGIEAAKSGAIILALFQNRVPTEAGLRAFQIRNSNSTRSSSLRDTPFAVMIRNREIVLRPSATHDILGCFHFILVALMLGNTPSIVLSIKNLLAIPPNDFSNRGWR